MLLTGVTGPLTTTTRADGSTQIVLAGHPLYRFAADAARGDVTGQGVGGTWYAVSPSGTVMGAEQLGHLTERASGMASGF